MALFRQVTIVGLGLMGGSLGLVLKRKRLAATVVGLSRTQATWREAKRRRVIDAGTTDPRQAVRDADLVVLAIPVDAIPRYAKRLTRFMKPGSVLTDVGSTKAAIVRTLAGRLPSGIAFVGGHPIAGSERYGLDAADAALFDGSLCILTPTGRTSPRALAAVKRFWGRIAGRVVLMSPARHDRLLAGTSHLPHLLAFCLADAVGRVPLGHSPRSLLDMTRLAESCPDLWDDIFLSNRASLRGAVSRFDRSWRRLRTAVARGDRAGLLRLLRRAQSARHAFKD